MEDPVRSSHNFDSFVPFAIGLFAVTISRLFDHF